MDINKLKKLVSLSRETVELIPTRPNWSSDTINKMFQNLRAITVSFMEGLNIRSDVKDMIPANKLGEFYNSVRKIHDTSAFSLKKSSELRTTVNSVATILDEIISMNKSSNLTNRIEVNMVPKKKTWELIESEFDISKRGFGIKINFITDKYKRKIIFRDIEHAYELSKSGFSKPAVILAGGVIEEILRQYLKHKNINPQKKSFDSYIKTCENNNLLKASISRLSDSVRHFRNLVHLAVEESKQYTISKSTASGAVSSIFTIVDGF